MTLLAADVTVSLQNKSRPHSRGEYNVYSTFQSHEPEFDYLKSLEIEEKINKIRWLPQQNAAHFLLSTNGKDTSFLHRRLHHVNILLLGGVSAGFEVGLMSSLYVKCVLFVTL